LKRLLIGILKIAVPVGILAWLWHRVLVHHPQAVEQLWSHQKHWELLILSGVLIFAATALSFVRWHLLMRAIEIPIRIRDSLRLGFLGFLMNFVAPGGVGGDLFKAVFVAREQKNRRAAVVATVLIDRICGVYGLLLLATTGLLITRFGQHNSTVALVARATYVCTALGTLGLIFFFTPGMTSGRFARRLCNLPKLGGTIERAFLGIELYRRRKAALALIGIASVIVHLTLAVGVFAAACGLYDRSTVPTLPQHLVISPLAGVAGALPFSPGGLGSYEFAIAFLYDLSNDLNEGHGVVVGLAYRLVTLAVAGVGLVFYWSHRAEYSAVMHRAMDEQHAA
jgi:uncharacterized membrane protein YbhN (UPF0104 family)